MLVLVLLLYRDTILYLGGLWSQFEGGPYGHGFLVLAVSLYLIYHRREKILALAPCPGAGALPVVAVCVLVWLVTSLADVMFVQTIVLLSLIIALIWAITGWPVTRQLLFPVMFTVFALPLWSPLQPVLREMTATGAFSLIRLSGITAFLQGYDVQLPSGRLSIEAACSGLNYLLAALTLGVFYAWLNYRRFSSRLLVVGMAASAAVVANILRVFIIIYLAYVTDMQHPFVKEHLMLGWYLFGALVLVLLIVDHMIYRRRAITGKIEKEPVGTSGSTDCGYGHRQYFLLLFAITTLIVSGPVIAWWAKNRPVAMPNAVFALPAAQSGWSGPVSVNDSWTPLYHGATGVMRGYHKDDTRVLLYVGYYPQQSQGSELINDLNSISRGEDWPRTTAERPVVSSNGLRVLETEMVSANGQRRLVWYVYRVAGRYTTSRYVAKILQVAGLLTGQQSAAVLALAADRDEDIARVRRELGEFLTVMEPALSRIADGQPTEQGQNG